jgi:hypothetical protein
VDARFLRRLGRRVTPASLRIGSKEARRRTFLVGATREAGELRLTLGPVPSCPPGRARAVLDFSDAGQDYWLAGTVAATADGGGELAELIVDSGPTRRPGRSMRLAPAADVAFAVCIVEVEGGGRQCVPILDIGVRGMRVETSMPLEVGTVLGDLVVIFRREVLRSGEGVVTSCSPALYPDGRRVYECGVRYRSSGRRQIDTPVGDRMEIDDLARVRAILWALCDLEYEVTMTGPTGVVRGRMLPQRGIDRTRVPELRCRVDDADRLPVRSGAVVVECSLFGSGYRFYARVSDRRADVLTLSPSPKLREWHRRGEERTTLGPESGAMVSYRHALTGARRAHPLVDLSSHGFSFPPGASDEELWAGLPLKEVRIHFGDLAFRAPEVAIRSVSAGRVSAEMRALPDRDADLMREKLIEHGRDSIRFHDGRGFDELVDFHRSMNLLEDDMEANLAKTLDETRRTWRLAHDRRAGLMRTAIVPWRGGIGATLTSVRAYERTWVFQHSAVASGAVPAGAGQLHGILMRLAAHRRDGEYIAGAIDTSAKTMHGLVSTFFSQSAPAHRGAMRLSLYAAPAGPRRPLDPAVVRRLRGREESLVEHVGARQLDPVCARALSLRAGEIELPETRAAYARLGIERGRDAHGAFRDDQCVAVLLRETASPGLCLSGLMSASFLFPVLPGADPDGTRQLALCDLARAAPVPGDPPNRFLFVPTSNDHGPVLAAGFRPIGECTYFALHRLGIVEYQRYIADKYGLLQARLRRRVAHLPEAA